MTLPPSKKVTNNLTAASREQKTDKRVPLIALIDFLLEMSSNVLIKMCGIRILQNINVNHKSKWVTVSRCFRLVNL